MTGLKFSSPPIGDLCRQTSHNKPADTTWSILSHDNAAYSWRWWAHCSIYDEDIFFPPENERSAYRIRREALARRICSGCLVMAQCRAEAFIKQEDYGIWGGLTEQDRARE